MKKNTQQLLAALVMITLFAACSRPVAYFQPTPREHFTTAPLQAKPVSSAEIAAPVAAEVVTPSAVAATPTEQLAQATVALDKVDAMVRNDSKLTTDKSVQKRLGRIRTLLAATSAKASLTPNATTAPKKMNLVERMMLKKMNRKINKELAPNNPNKPMANTGVLAAGAVLVIVGIILLFVSGASTVGVILLLAGAVILLVGLL